MKLIHCSDLHLDSPLGSHYTPEKARIRNAELRAAFARIVEFAIDQQVDAVLIAGDLFDHTCVSAHTAAFVLEQMARAKDVTFFYLRGNHDGTRDALDTLTLPENLKTFGTSWTGYDWGDVRITGVEPHRQTQQLPLESLELSRQRLNIVMLHGQVSTQPGRDLIPLPLLRGKHIDYLALGHVHSYQTGKLDDRGIFCYSGCPEGRGFDECGDKGFVLLETDGQRISHRFIPFASRKLVELAVDISAAETATQILAEMKQASARIDREHLVKFVLTGTCAMQTHKDIPFLQKMLEPEFFLVRIKDQTRLKIDRETYEYDVSLKGEFVRCVLASERSEEEKSRIIRCGICALSGEEVTP